MDTQSQQDIAVRPGQRPALVVVPAARQERPAAGLREGRPEAAASPLHILGRATSTGTTCRPPTNRRPAPVGRTVRGPARWQEPAVRDDRPDRIGEEPGVELAPPIGDHTSADTSTAIGAPPARSHTHPSTSVSQERYSKSPAVRTVGRRPTRNARSPGAAPGTPAMASSIARDVRRRIDEVPPGK